MSILSLNTTYVRHYGFKVALGVTPILFTITLGVTSINFNGV